MGEKRIEILGKDDSDKSLLNSIYDPKTGKYVIPVKLSPNMRIFGINKLMDAEKRKTGPKVAVLDTGVLFDHPLIKYSLDEHVNFIDEETDEDQNGHGTIVALQVIMTNPSIKLLSAKVMDSKGEGTEENLIKGIEWAVDHGAKIISISLGRYSKHWGFRECDGTCELCHAAEKAANAGVTVVAAAGNKAGETSCPAKVGLVKDIGVISVSAYDIKTKSMAYYSGKGTILAEGTIILMPLE